jgi:hypothetical protein
VIALAMSRHVAWNTHLVQLALDAQAAAPLHFQRGLRIRARDAPVVERAGLSQLLDCRVDVFRSVLTFEQPCLELRHRQLAPGQHLQACSVCGGLMTHDLWLTAGHGVSTQGSSQLRP